jgi:predicted alpha/beta hydrolase family esterase
LKTIPLTLAGLMKVGLMKIPVLFVQGGGEGAHDVDAALVASLKKTLGANYEVSYPRMPRESKPDMKAWKAKIAGEVETLPGGLVLVGHSVGGSALLKYLSEENVEKPIAGLFLLAAPSWDEENWDFDEFKLPRDLADKVSRIPRIFLYHNRDDEIVPFSHLALHAARLPRAVFREGESGGHQFGEDLTKVARDITGATRAMTDSR